MPEILPATRRTALVADALRQSEADFTRLLPQFMQSQRERFLQLAVEAAQRPDLLGCTPGSVVAAVMKAAQAGLPLDGTHATLTRYGQQAQFIPMFQGMIVAAMRNGKVRKVWSAVVYDGDEFDQILGSDPRLVHRPGRGPRTVESATHVYACAKLDSGETLFEVMDRAQVLAIKRRSKAQKGPWSSPQDEPEMWRKTAVRRLAKYLPKSPDLQVVLEADSEFDKDEQREIEADVLDSAAEPNGRAARSLDDLVPHSGAEEPDAPHSHWAYNIEVLLPPPAEWIEERVGGKGPLSGLTWRQAASSADPKIYALVQRLLEEGAQQQADKGRAHEHYQRLAEACRVAALPAGPDTTGFLPEE